MTASRPWLGISTPSWLIKSDTPHLRSSPGTRHYGVPAYDHADPYHSDPGGEFTRIDAAPTIGTSSVNFTILGPAE